MDLLISSLHLLIGNVTLLSAANLSEHFHIEMPSFIPTSPLGAQRSQPSIMSRIPELTRLDLAQLCTKYLRAQFKYKLNAWSSGASVTLPEQLGSSKGWGKPRGTRGRVRAGPGTGQDSATRQL